MNKKKIYKKMQTSITVALLLLTILFVNVVEASAPVTDCSQIPGGCSAGVGCVIIFYDDCTLQCVNRVTGEEESALDCPTGPE